MVKICRYHFDKAYDASDIRKSIIAAIVIKVVEPVLESQAKTKSGSTDMEPDLPTVRTFINDFIRIKFDNFLHKKIKQSKKERKELSGFRK